MKKKHFASLSIFQIMAQLRRGIFYFFLSIYLKEFLGVSNTEMTLFATLPMVANILAQSTIWGRISDKFKKRRLLIVFGELFAAIGYLIVFWIHNSINKGKIGIGHISEVAFSQSDLLNYIDVASTFDVTNITDVLRVSAYVIIVGFTIIEAGWSSSNLGWTTLIADLTRDSERSRIMGLLQFVGGIGNIIGVTASAFLYKDGFGFWSGDLFYISSGILIFSIFALFLIPESYADLDEDYFKDDKTTEEETLNRNLIKNTGGKNAPWEWKIFAWLLVVLAIINIGGNSVNQMISIHIRLPDTFAASDVVVAQLRNATSISMIIAGLSIGFLTSRFGDAKLLLVGFLCALVGTIMLPFAPHIIIFFIYMALRGFSRVWIQTTAYSMVNRGVPLEKRGKMMGFFNATFYLSWGLGGTIITGPIADAIVYSNLITILVYMIFFLVIIGIWIFLLIRHVTKLNTKKKSIYITSAGLFIAIIGIITAFVANPISKFIINSGNIDSYAYKVTFFVATGFILIGVLTFLFFRPDNFKLLSLNKNAKTG